MSARLPHSVRVLSVICGSVLLVLAGCQTQSASRAPQPPPATVSSARPTVAAPVTSAAPAGSGSTDAESHNGAVPEALTQKTAAFAKSMESAAAPVPPAPSSVRWGNPPAPAQPAAPLASANAPASTATPSAAAHRASATLKSTAKSDSDEPLILPESSDFTDVPHAAPKPAADAETDTLEADIERRARETPQDTAAQLDYQLLELLKNGNGAELAALSAASPEDREVIAALTDGLSNFRNGVRQDGNMLLSAKIKPLLDMSDRLRSLADLSVDTMVLCRRVDNFGRYEPMDTRFRAGRENPTIVYCEIQNFASRQNAQTEWETKLSQQVSLYTETGILVWKDRMRDVNDTCRERRHDFFVTDLIRLPANLTIGRYIVKITIVDRLANRVAEKTLPIDIVADPNDATVSDGQTVVRNVQ